MHACTSNWFFNRASLGAQIVKNLPVRQETWVQSLGWEDPLEEGMATHSSILTWKIPMDKRSLVGCSRWGRPESDMAERLRQLRPFNVGKNSLFNKFCWEPSALQSWGTGVILMREGHLSWCGIRKWTVKHGLYQSYPPHMTVRVDVQLVLNLEK